MNYKGIWKNFFNSFINESHELLNPEIKGASLDNQVDSLLETYENESREKNVINEAGEDDEGGDEEGDEGDDDNSEPNEPDKLTRNDIDLEEYANKANKLIENFFTLIEVKNTVFRKSINHLSRVYDADTVKEYQSLLREEHGFERSSFDDDQEAPIAIGAGSSGGGGSI